MTLKSTVIILKVKVVNVDPALKGNLNLMLACNCQLASTGCSKLACLLKHRYQRPWNLHLPPVKLEGLFSPKKGWGHDARAKYPDVLLSSKGRSGGSLSIK